MCCRTLGGSSGLGFSLQGGHCPVPSMEALEPEDDPPVLPRTLDAGGATFSGEVTPQPLEEAEQTSALRTSRASFDQLPAFQEVFMQMQVLLPLNKQLLIVPCRNFGSRFPPTVFKKDNLHFFSPQLFVAGASPEAQRHPRSCYLSPKQKEQGYPVRSLGGIQNADVWKYFH